MPAAKNKRKRKKEEEKTTTTQTHKKAKKEAEHKSLWQNYDERQINTNPRVK